MKKIELLAPAKNYEYGMTAIKCGADAVYIGAESFGARLAAGNTTEEIKKLIDFAHFYNSKVYVTVNTILNDAEMILAQKLIENLYNIGADAVIVQDMGLLELDLPPIPLFASTQTHNNSAEKVEFLEKVGFKRVILARELSLDEIKKIKSSTNVELEAFVHGSLCVSYSGQCYLSQVNGGRSGNRGVCAQPCRKKYSLKEKNGNFLAEDTHLLSLKDMNFSESLEALIDAGVTSFKIEGRLKDLNYVKNIVSYYRQALDSIAESGKIKASSSGKTLIDFEPDPSKTFNRDYTDYFLNGRIIDITSFDSPKNVGSYVGTVQKVLKSSFILDEAVEPLNNGDGLTFFDNEHNLIGTSVNDVNDIIVTPNSIKHITEGAFIYRNHDHKFIKMLESYVPLRKIEVNFEIKFDEKELAVKAVDENNNTVTEYYPNNFEIAKDQQKAFDNIKKQFSKLGETSFIVGNVEIIADIGIFIPISELNKIRRTVIEKLEALRNISYQNQTVQIEKNDFPFPEQQVDYRANIMNKYAKAFYIRHGAEITEMAAETGTNLKEKQIMETKHCLRYRFSLCPKHHDAENNDDLILIDEKQRNYLLKFDCSNCTMKMYY